MLHRINVGLLSSACNQIKGFPCAVLGKQMMFAMSRTDESSEACSSALLYANWTVVSAGFDSAACSLACTKEGQQSMIAIPSWQAQVHRTSGSPHWPCQILHRRHHLPVLLVAFGFCRPAAEDSQQTYSSNCLVWLQISTEKCWSQILPCRSSMSFNSSA